MATIKYVTLQDGQTIFDIALQYYGSVSRVFDLIQLNSDQITSVMDQNIQGKTLKYEEQTNDVAVFFKNRSNLSGTPFTVKTRLPQLLGSSWNDSFLLAIDQAALSSFSNVSTNPFS